jgi:hypothetical protein
MSPNFILLRLSEISPTNCIDFNSRVDPSFRSGFEITWTVLNLRQSKFITFACFVSCGLTLLIQQCSSDASRSVLGIKSAATMVLLSPKCTFLVARGPLFSAVAPFVCGSYEENVRLS